MRKIIQINTIEFIGVLYIYALCNDNTVWRKSTSGDNYEWFPVKNIPQKGYVGEKLPSYMGPG